MSSEKTEQLEKALIALSQELTDTLAKVSRLYDYVVEIKREVHADHRLLIALASIWVQQGPEPLALVDLLRKRSVDLYPAEEEMPETVKKLEHYLGWLEKAAAAQP